jgi:sulfur carrier protein
MRIYVNGDQREIEPESLAPTLALALSALGYGGKKIATAVNGRFVAAKARPTVKLAEGDKIEVVAPMQGG